MKLLRVVLWIAVLVTASALGFLTYKMTQTKEAAAGGPFGVPFTLVAQNGQPITEKALTGRPSAVFFGFTHCPEVCPTTLFEMNGWLQTVDPDNTKLNAFFVTVDPERDTPEILGQYVSNVTSRVTGISGPPDKVMEMVKGFRVFAKKVPLDAAKPDGDYTMDHSASVFLLDADGGFRGTIAYGENTETAIQKLKNLTKS
ncbi:protein SCO1/2 [Rhizobium sp. PP-F2F-G48]|uniref:SCO family protein n=1 Tax=Rhizobium sp. PP-F2F-G48 TaxID=2135651 RepID=UPI00104A95E8|nr:SCO family protein [Rhizobium sp. PP-F2F-G48]TCM58638.1 protein SCO1/2 [Rhizobium sp. PP-F2F-G48]